MEFPVILPQTLAFSQVESVRNDFVRRATASLEKFPNFGARIKVSEENGDSSGCDTTQENLGQLKNVDLDKSLAVTVQVNQYDRSTEGCVSVWTTKSNADCYEQLKKASGGQLFVDIQFELGTAIGNFKTTVNEKNVEMLKDVNWNWTFPGPTGTVFIIGTRFNFTDSLSEIWRDTGRSTFTGKLSVSLRLDEKNAGQFGEILSLGQAQNLLVAFNKRMREDTNFTDATLVPGNGEGIKCHKIVLVASSDYFKKMFETKMKEGLTGTVNIPDMSSQGGQALLDYLYCQDTTKASESAPVALELLMKAGEYSIESLEKAMMQLIHVKGSDWFPVGVALQLFQFAKNKFENEGLPMYKFVMHKAAMLLKSKSKKEVEESKEFQEVFKNDKFQMFLFTYCMFCT